MNEIIGLFPLWEVVVSPFGGALEDVRETITVIAPDFTDVAEVALQYISGYVAASRLGILGKLLSLFR